MASQSETELLGGRALIAQPNLARKLGVTRMTVHRWRNTPGFPNAIKIGGRIFFDIALVNAWIATRSGELKAA
ncbi:MAG: helix-turn-helix domain-containing protein [Proteobacteria bacterium]|nr:helix-turn-helix domain-containing protein [Pseudomonadota bacterium]